MGVASHLTLQQIAEQQNQTEQQLKDLAALALRLAQQKGAEQSEVWCYNTIGNSLEVRQGELETLEFNQDSHLGINLYFEQRKGTVSINDLTEAAIEKGVQAAADIARFTELDPYSGLAEKGLMATQFRDLSLDHPASIDIPQSIELAQSCEAAALDNPLTKQSEGASFYGHRSVSVYANSHDFVGVNRTTRYSLSNTVIAQNDKGMIRDGYYSLARNIDDLIPAQLIGQTAAKRVTDKLQQGKVASGKHPIIFSPEVARTLWGHLFSAIKGGALYQKSSFLLDMKGQQIVPDFINIHEDPFILKGLGSSNFDSDGVATYKRDIVRDGILKDYFLSSYSARKLGLSTTANAGGIHNIIVDSTCGSLEQLMRQIGTGLLVTEVMGQGVNIVTGNYSRGASGFWFENGQIKHFVQEITIAGNLADMLNNIVDVASDVDKRSSILTGSVAIEGMIVAS
ncbi:MAG: metalloprotease PmbA [Kangiellaceae bacterium]|nr:metalloprotease PmbA [Kangiellaceae bacterium]